MTIGSCEFFLKPLEVYWLVSSGWLYPGKQDAGGSECSDAHFGGTGKCRDFDRYTSRMFPGSSGGFAHMFF